MNDRHRRVAKLKKQELNAAKAKLAREYGVSVEQAIEIAQSIKEAFRKIGTSLQVLIKNKHERQ
ncbi:toxin PIN [Enterococcus hirae]